MNGCIRHLIKKNSLCLSHLFFEGLLHVEQGLNGLVPIKDGINHIGLGNELGATFNHHNTIPISRHDQVDITLRLLTEGRIGHEFSVDPSHLHPGNGA